MSRVRSTTDRRIQTLSPASTDYSRRAGWLGWAIQLRWAILFAVLAFTFAISAPVRAEPTPSAIQGYDTVAYFTRGRPTLGRPDFAVDWNGQRWQFASAEHRDLFARDPLRYAPQYDGFCAGAMSTGEKHQIDPNNWIIVDDKLYLTGSPVGRAKIAADPLGTIGKADANWRAMQSKR